MTLSLVARRLGGLVVTVLLVSIVTFLVMRLVPGDPARLAADQGASPEAIQAIRAKWMLDRPLYEQLGHFVAGIWTGQLGISYRTGAPVWDEVKTRLGPTLLLAVCGTGASLVVGVLAGIHGALRRGTWSDAATTVLATLGISLPVFWLGLLLMMLFAAKLRWLPSTGWGDWRYLVLPSLTIGFGFAGSISRMARSSMLEVLRDDYIRTAVAKGLPKKVVIAKHALRNGLIPIITVAGLEFGRLLGGAVITESVFALPGLGRLVVDSVKFRDYPTVQACVVIFAVGIVFSTFLTDLLNMVVDPRLRRG